MADEWVSFPDAPRIVVPPPGPRSRALLDRQAALETDAVAYPRYFPIGVHEARGSTIEDVDGNRFIDWVAGISVLNLGHRHPAAVAALDRQAQRIWHALELPTEARIEFLEQFEAILPPGLRGRSRTFFTVTGGDAIETAVSLAEFVKRRGATVAFSGAYHGVHGGAVNLTSGRRYHATSAFRGGHVVRVPYPDPYHPVLGTADSAGGVVDYLEHLLRDPHSGVDGVSSVVVEPILGEGGYVVPPDDFLPRLRELCDRHDIVLILDEVQTGLGRTGAMWAVDHAGITPDILCSAKTLGGGLPLSAIAYRKDLAPELPKGFHLGTYRANPLALAVGAASLRLLREGGWVERAARDGPGVVRRFRSIASAHPSIGDVRGRGFMIGVEFVRDRTSRAAWPERASAVRGELFRRGLLMHTCGAYDQTLRFMSPLTIEPALLERGLNVFEAAIEALDEMPSGARGIGAPTVGGSRPAPEVWSTHLAPPSSPPDPVSPTPGPHRGSSPKGFSWGTPSRLSDPP